MGAKYPATPSSFVAARWLWFVIFFAVNSLIMGSAFKMHLFNASWGEKAASLFQISILGQTYLSASRSINSCLNNLICVKYASFISVFMIYMSISVLFFIVFIAMIFLKSDISLIKMDQAKTICITTAVALLNFSVTDYTSGKIIIFGFNLTRVDGSGSFIIGDNIIITLSLFSATIAVLNIAILTIRDKIPHRSSDK